MNKSYIKLRKEIVSWGLDISKSQDEISAITGVSQSQVSKILSGNFKTVSPNVKKICEYASIQIYMNIDVDIPEEIKEAVLDLWDGSKESEKALVKTLKNMKGLIGSGCINS
jgi:transcriptional regulator with XRE-family HTH domain